MAKCTDFVVQKIKSTGVKACMEANAPMNEEPYEVGLDNHGCIDGPKTGRLRISNNVRAYDFPST